MSGGEAGSAAGPTGGIFQRSQRIRFGDCDPSGTVYFPQYFVMFNGLVEDWFADALQIGYRALVVERRIGLPSVHLEADFLAVSRLADRVSLTLQVERLGRRSIALALHCLGAAGEPRMKLRQVLVTTSLDSHRAVDIPPDLRAAIAHAAGIDA